MHFLEEDAGQQRTFQHRAGCQLIYSNSCVCATAQAVARKAWKSEPAAAERKDAGAQRIHGHQTTG